MRQSKKFPVVLGSTSRYRLRLSRLGRARRLTHLEQIKAIRRSVQEAGFKSSVKPAFGPAISMGYESTAEYLDLKFSAPVALTQIREKMTAALPEGFSLMEAKRIPALFPSIEAVANVVEYEVVGPFPKDAQQRWMALLERGRLPMVKFKKGVLEWIDALDQILKHERVQEDHFIIRMRFGPKRSIKPERLLSGWLELDERWVETSFRIRRREILCESTNGKLSTP